MEILIIGVILVALMAYVSTKIKKSAASAFERETIETEEFSIIKPENFINPTGENSEFAFTALSKDFGTEAAEDLRQAKAELRVYPNADFDEVCRTAERTIDKIFSKAKSEERTESACILSGEKTENEIETEIFYKIIESKTRNKIYELKISVLNEFRENYSAAVSEFLNGFKVKR
jgi:hypothetical protein